MGLVIGAGLAGPRLGADASGTDTGPAFSSSPGEGLTGSQITVTGEGCFLPSSTTAGDGTVVALVSETREVVASTTVPVAADGTWSGRLPVPSGTAAAEYELTAHCISPGYDEVDPVVYASRTFTVTGAGPESGAAPEAPATPTFGSGIEPYPTYDGQSTCSPTAKPGTVAFRDMVLRAYPGTTDYGIVRACNVGGTSEHKEGRAWDWHVNASSSTDRAKVDDLMRWLLATDGYGNRHANARRLGIMYIIWNHQMLRLYRIDAGWQPYSGPNPHTDHVHFSLTRAGGDKLTSFWSGGTAPPPPPPPPPAEWTPSGYEGARITVGGSYDPPLTGDFDGDGRDDILWYGPGTAPDYIWWGTSGGGFTAGRITVGGTYAAPVTGDFNGDHRDDILWYGPGDARDYLWFGNSGRSFTGHSITVTRAYEHVVPGDYNGDGLDDIVFYNPEDGFDYLWQGTIYGFLGKRIWARGNYEPFAGDFDGNRRADIFWYGPGDGPDYLWSGDADGGFTGKNIGRQGDFVPAVGDFNGDHRDDVLWVGADKDAVWTGRSDLTFKAWGVTVGGTYDHVLTGDYDGNGRSDVIFYGAGSTADYYWRY